MGIMAISTFLTGIMLFRIYPWDVGSGIVRIAQVSMAAQAESPRSINCQKFRIVRVIQGRTVAIFALNGAVFRRKIFFGLIVMALCTVLLSTIFHGKILPVVNIPGPIKPIGKILAVFSLAMNAEIIGHDCSPCQ